MAGSLGTQLPPEARAALSKLQTSSTSIPFEEVRHIIEQDLNAPIESCFDEFEEVAFAAASIGQVHKAMLNGVEVAVKVQYPGIAKLISMDLSLVGNMMATFLAGSSLPGKAMAQELRDRIVEECDYLNEAHNQQMVKSRCDGLPNEHVPGVVMSHTSSRVLTTEFVRGMSFEEFSKSASQEVKDKAGLVVFSHAMQSIFDFCYFNGDPHPGNYLFHDDGSVTFLDFGCIKKFNVEFIRNWKEMAKTVLENNKEENIHAVNTMGLIGNFKKFDHDFQWDMFQHLYAPFLTDDKFVINHGYNSEVSRLMLWENKNRFSMTLPSDLLFANRLQWGLYGLLGDLKAANYYKPVFHNAVYGDEKPLFST